MKEALRLRGMHVLDGAVIESRWPPSGNPSRPPLNLVDGIVESYGGQGCTERYVSISSGVTKRRHSAPSSSDYTLHLDVTDVQNIPSRSRVEKSNVMRPHLEPGDRSKEQLRIRR